MTRKLWWATLNHSSPRYADWRRILGEDRVILLSPFPVQAGIAGETCEVLLLDWQDLDCDASERLLDFIANKFGAEKEEINADLDRDGFFPIRAADVNIFYDMRAFL